MPHLPILNVEHRLVREIACVHCYQRPPGSEAFDPSVPRPCETKCSLFYHLPTLVEIARRVDDTPGSCERALKARVCSKCKLSPTAGSFCAEYANRTCALSRYAADVVAALQRVLVHGPPQPTAPAA